MSTVWQIAAGSGGRDYSQLFIQYDLMFLGPSYPGTFVRETYEKEATAEEINMGAVGTIETFVGAVAPGDFVLLRRGSVVVALGVVHDEGYLHDATFDDVRGWDVGHTRRVVWQDHLSAELEKLQAKVPLLTGRLKTFSRVHNPEVLGKVVPLLARCTARLLHPRPSPLPPPLTPEALAQALRSRGLASAVVERVVQTIDEQCGLLRWYREFGGRSARPNEHEVVAHMVLPLLRALGWSERLLAVEWHDVDVAGFSGVPTNAETCTLVCEAKALWHGLQGVEQQAFGYHRTLRLNRCDRVLVTQGSRFHVYRRGQAGAWAETGYLNIEQPRTDHVASPGSDAVTTLLALTPTGAPG